MLRTAMVGLGSWGQTLVRSVQGKSDALLFTAACTRTPQKAEGFCRDNGIRLVGSFDDILEDRAVDAVVLATPNSQHAGQIAQAARRGKHVFVEKPFTLDSASARSAIDAAAAAGVVLAVGFNRRLHPSMRELRRRVKSGALGIIGSIIAELTATTALYRPSESWRVDPAEEPAGAMAGTGVHLVDSMIDIIGRIREVHCIAEQRAGPHGADTTSLLVRFESGVTGLAFCSIAAARNYRVAVYGSKGFAEVVGPAMDTFRFIPAAEGRASHLAKIPDAEEIATPGFQSIAEELTQFAACIRAGRAYLVPLDDVLHGVCVFEAAVESARAQRPVAVRA
ncbi:MAG: Gfo/Idh/MocA family oxidoreductase [Betaproteobacteria bacterium]|nr:Gfo/Idh/MocA family oxidoreductase [Gammaproteobacteria bacterium]MDH3437726.1 Gfo/Idh/MocA family oxidoreductase [Betaproteobacteria bacterium]